MYSFKKRNGVNKMDSKRVGHEVYSGPHKWDNVLRCIFNQMEIPNGQKKVQQGIEGSNRAWRNKGSENDSRISLSHIGLAWTLQVCLIGNLFVFFHGELYSLKVLGRVIMLSVMLPMVLSNNKRLHEIGMGIFFIGFIYTIVKYHIYT